MSPAGKHRYELRAVAALKPNPKNARKHPKRQIAEIKRSYAAYGVINPIIVAPDLTILAGHGRHAAAVALGLAEVPVLVVEGLTPAQLKAYALADNKLGDMSSFDMELVLGEIEAIREDDDDFDITLTGFATAEIDIAIGAARTADLNDLDDDRPVPPPILPVTRKGDLWLLGEHRLICGDSTEPAVVDRLVDGKPVRLLLSDVPFNVKIKGNVSGLGKKVHDEFAMASGEMNQAEFVAFLKRSAEASIPHLVDGAMVLWFIDWRHVAEMLEAGAASGFALKKHSCMGEIQRRDGLHVALSA